MRLNHGLMVVLAAVLAVGCSAGGAHDRAATTVGESTSTPGEGSTTTPTGGGETSTLKPGAQPGLFDFNQDGTKEPTCGTADYKADLVIRTYCDELSGYANSPESGATLVSGALFGQPTPPDDPRDKPITDGASVSPIHLQGADGKEVVVYTLSSDTVFDVGSDRLQDPALDSL